MRAAEFADSVTEAGRTVTVGLRIEKPSNRPPTANPAAWRQVLADMPIQSKAGSCVPQHNGVSVFTELQPSRPSASKGTPLRGRCALVSRCSAHLDPRSHPSLYGKTCAPPSKPCRLRGRRSLLSYSCGHSRRRTSPKKRSRRDPPLGRGSPERTETPPWWWGLPGAAVGDRSRTPKAPYIKRIRAQLSVRT